MIRNALLARMSEVDSIVNFKRELNQKLNWKNRFADCNRGVGVAEPFQRARVQGGDEPEGLSGVCPVIFVGASE